jgi:hypothetical protein
MSKLLDFSKKISDKEMVTAEKLESLVLTNQIQNINIQKFGDFTIQDYVLTFDTKTIEESLNKKSNTIQLVLTIWGGGSSGIKGGDFNSSFATGGYSSGIILRFPIDINPQNKFMVIRIGKGGPSYEMSSSTVINNGQFSSFQLCQSEYDNAYMSAKFRNVETSETKTTELEKLISYGGGIIEGDEIIIESNSTDLFFGFNGSNKNNTNQPSEDLDDYDHRNFYAPYLSKYDGYNSFIGLGGKHNGVLDADENSGAGGAGYLPKITKELDKNGNVLPARVGKGGDGGCILEYQNQFKLNIYAIGFVNINESNNKLVLNINDSFKSLNLNVEIIIENQTYDLNSFIRAIQSDLPEESSVTLVNSRLKISIPSQWTVDIKSSSKELLTQLGFTSNDNKKWSTLIQQPNYEVTFSFPIYDICKVEELK